jgi:integrase
MKNRERGFLSVKRIAKLTAPGRYADGGNLYLRVKPSGSRQWLFRYVSHGQERYMGLGGLKTNTLDEARALAKVARQQLRDGIDPVAARDAKRAAVAAERAKNKTFEECAVEYYNDHAHQWSTDKYRAKFLSSLRMYAFKEIGKLPIGAIDTNSVLRVLKPIWATKRDTANRVRQRIENVLGWATVHGLRTGDNPARWKGHLSEALPAKTEDTQHFARLPYSEVPAFVASLADQRGIAPKALEFLILTAARSGEVIGARWDEIDFEEKRWVIPGPRMKQKNEHRVPLVARAIAILRELPREGEYVFIGAKAGHPLGKNAFLKLIWAMGRQDITIHGFRSSFRDWAGEDTAFPADVCEVALAHAVGGKVQIAYQRGDLLDKRRRLMEAWAAYCCTTHKGGATVTPIRKRR